MPSRILVLEPDPTRQVAFRAALASAGHTSRTVATEAEATDRLRTEAFSLVLLGPQVESVATARALRESERTPAVVRLAVLPDCVVAEQPPGGGGAPARDLPAILEALTRYMRFAPPREAGSFSEQQKLLQDWTDYDRRSEVE